MRKKRGQEKRDSDKGATNTSSNTVLYVNQKQLKRGT